MLAVYTKNDKSKWDEILACFPINDVYWRFDYANANKYSEEDEIYMFHYVGRNSEAIYITAKRLINKSVNDAVYYDLITPYGYGGWLVHGILEDEMYYEFDRWCKSNNIVSEFVRFHPILHNELIAVPYKVTELGSIVSIPLLSECEIWNNITSKNKNAIRKAQKLGVKVYYSNEEKIYREFQSIYRKTMERKQADKFYLFKEEYFDPFKTSLTDNSKMFYAIYNGKIIAMCLMIYENEIMNYHLSGSLEECRNIPATNLILYEAARWGLSNGIKTLALGGGLRSTQDSLYKFKKSFAKHVKDETFRIGSRIILPEIYDKLSENIVDDTQFFPKYRAQEEK